MISINHLELPKQHNLLIQSFLKLRFLPETRTLLLGSVFVLSLQSRTHESGFLGRGDQVAAAIWAWRNTDGFSTVIAPYLGVAAIGAWRSTPPGNLPFSGLQFATMTPWVINSPSQFRPGGPPALNSAQYATEFNETKDWGKSASSVRSPDETLYSQFWNASTAPYYWNQIAVELSAANHLTLSENARLLALVTVSMATERLAAGRQKCTISFGGRSRPSRTPATI